MMRLAEVAFLIARLVRACLHECVWPSLSTYMVSLLMLVLIDKGLLVCAMHGAQVDLVNSDIVQLAYCFGVFVALLYL